MKPFPLCKRVVPASRARRAVTGSSGRRYILCGLRVRWPRRGAVLRRILLLIPGATLALVTLCSVYARESVELYPDLGPRAPIASVSNYTIDDFVSASR